MEIKPEVSQVRLKSYSDFNIATGASKLASRRPLGGVQRVGGGRRVAGGWPACGRRVGRGGWNHGQNPPYTPSLIHLVLTHL